MAYRNKYDQTGESSQMGESAELQFKKIAEKLGNQVVDATFRGSCTKHCPIAPPPVYAFNCFV